MAAQFWCIGTLTLFFSPFSHPIPHNLLPHFVPASSSHLLIVYFMWIFIPCSNAGNFNLLLSFIYACVSILLFFFFLMSYSIKRSITFSSSGNRVPHGELHGRKGQHGTLLCTSSGNSQASTVSPHNPSSLPTPSPTLEVSILTDRLSAMATVQII
jgi:hypothetical protein